MEYAPISDEAEWAARQVSLPVVYDGVRLDAGLRLDLLAAG